MTPRKNTSRFISILAVSLLCCALSAQAQRKKMVPQEPDSTAFFKGFAVSADLVGAIQLAVSDYGQYEGALRINLKDRWFPIFELGYGKADHSDAATRITYKTSAPYGRVGMDFNLLKNKHDSNRLYGGFRYAYTNYKFEFFNPGVEDPVWLENVEFKANDISSYYHWVEAVVGIDAAILGPVHLGWSVRYKRRLAHNEGPFGKSWYVPGYGTTGSSRLGGTFNIIIDI